MIPSLPTLMIAAVALCALLLSLKSVVATRALKKEIDSLRKQLDALPVETETSISFSENLAQIERKVAPVVDGPVSGADKYRYVAALAEQGVDAEGIAAALQMAPAEVEQLLQLSRLKTQAVEAEH